MPYCRRYRVKSGFDRLAEESDLTEMEAHVFRLLHNIPIQPLSFAQIAEMFGVSKQRVEQIESLALSRLRRRVREQEIEYLDA